MDNTANWGAGWPSERPQHVEPVGTSRPVQEQAPDSKPWPTPKPPPKLETASDIAKELGSLYQRFARSACDVNDASKLANILSILNRILETSDLEKRIEALERRGATYQ